MRGPRLVGLLLFAAGGGHAEDADVMRVEADGIVFEKTGDFAYAAHHNATAGDTLEGLAETFYPGAPGAAAVLERVNEVPADVPFDAPRRVVLPVFSFRVGLDPAEASEQLDAALDCQESFGAAPLTLTVQWDLVRYLTVDPETQPTLSQVVLETEAGGGKRLELVLPDDTLSTDVFFNRAVAASVACLAADRP